MTNIRLVRPDEHVALRTVRLSALAYSPHLIEHLAKEGAEPIEYWQDRANDRAKAIASATFVAVADETFVGVVDGFISDDGKTVEIGGMWVSPALRRSGIGQKLLGAVCDWAQGRGAGRAGLWVQVANNPARLLYERAGFAVRARGDAERAGLRLERRL